MSRDLIEKIRDLAGALGDGVHDSGGESEQFQCAIDCGLAEAVVDLSGFTPARFSYWIGFCMSQMGIDPADPRAKNLLESFQKGLESLCDEADTDDAQE